MSTIQADIEARLSEVEPDVEVLLAEVVGGRLVRLFIDHPDGVTLDLCERVTNQLPEVREKYALEVSSPGADRPLTKPEHFRRFLGHRARVRTRGDARRPALVHRRAARGGRRGRDRRRRHRRRLDRVLRHPPIQPPGGLSMSQEIVDAVRVLGREKGISEEKLMLALEDALLSAYKKQPGAARYARVRDGPRLG